MGQANIPKRSVYDKAPTLTCKIVSHPTLHIPLVDKFSTNLVLCGLFETKTAKMKKIVEGQFLLNVTMQIVLKLLEIWRDCEDKGVSLKTREIFKGI